MTIPGHRTLRATVLAMACAVGAVSVSKSNDLSTNQLSRPVDQDDPRSSNTKSPHRYTLVSNALACGAIPYRGYEGRITTRRAKWMCTDGVIIFSIKEGYGSTRGAEAERIVRLEAGYSASTPWQIKRTESVGNAMVVELTEPVSVGEGATNKWVVIWAHERLLSLVYGPDRDHVMDFFQTHYNDSAKQ